MKYSHAFLGAVTFLAITSAYVCAQEGKQDKIHVALPVQREVADFVECMGRTQSAEYVKISPRVTGFVIETPFKEGAHVKKGEVLFKIDSRPYEAQYKAGQAQLAADKAKLRYAEAVNKRYQELAKKNPEAISARELDQHQAFEDLSRSDVARTEANLPALALKLEWTTVRSPIDGRVGRRFVTVGNLVTQDVTMLTSVVTLDPMHVHFDLDQPSYLRTKRAVENGKIADAGPNPTLKAHMALADEDGYPHQGSIDFFDNQADAKTGEVSMRAVFANPKLPRGTQLLVPGLFVRLHIVIGPPRAGLLVASSKVHRSVTPTGQLGRNWVFVVDRNEIQRRDVKLGHLEPDGLYVIEEGLKKDDRVVVGGIFEANMRVRPEQVEQVLMPMIRANESKGNNRFDSDGR